MHDLWCCAGDVQFKQHLHTTLTFNTEEEEEEWVEGDVCCEEWEHKMQEEIERLRAKDEHQIIHHLASNINFILPIRKGQEGEESKVSGGECARASQSFPSSAEPQPYCWYGLHRHTQKTWVWNCMWISLWLQVVAIQVPHPFSHLCLFTSSARRT